MCNAYSTSVSSLDGLMKVFCVGMLMCYQLLKKDPVKGTLSLEILRGWLSIPEGFNVTLDLKKGGEDLCTLL